jgi:hypothetical protein
MGTITHFGQGLGRRNIWLSAGDAFPTATNGCTAAAAAALGDNLDCVQLVFDNASTEHCIWIVELPSNYPDSATFTAEIFWNPDGNPSPQKDWSFSGACVRDDSILTGGSASDYGTAITFTEAGSGSPSLLQGVSGSGALTLGGATAEAGNLAIFKLSSPTGGASAGTDKVLGIRLEF